MEAGESQHDESEELQGPAYLIFSGPISQQNAQELARALGICVNQRLEEVHLLLNTFGGNVNAGVFLHNFLLGLPYKLVTHNTGNVASIGVAVYLAGDERLACARSTFFTHGVSSTPPQGQSFGAKWFRETHDSILDDEARINRIMDERTHLDEEELNKRSEIEQTTDPEAAVREGTAHRIEEINIPADAAYVYTIEAIE